MAGRLISLVSMALTTIPVYLLAKHLFDSHTAFWSGLTFILLPEVILQSNSVLRDPGYILFFTVGVYFVKKL